ncbi:MAG TPA: 2Fe-2S iron-sulfur cluster-binding protein [Thermoanaerobaculia bacterium]|nr:2Fe-2S iron-sulfur cluster-binding protein [Thermoanaerobaculia bacterium]
MPRVTFEDQDKAAEFPAGRTLLSCALELGVTISHVCGGDGACGTCRVEVAGSCWDLLTPPTPDETYKELERPYRLSCQAKLIGDVIVKVARIE